VLAAVGLLLAALCAVEVAEGFFSRGVIDAELGYSDLQIYKDQEEYWSGSVLSPSPKAGRRHGYRWSPYGIVRRDEYYLNGVLENLSNRTRYGLRVVFYASDCVRQRIHWTVTVNVDRLGPHQSYPFREFISYVEPAFACRMRFHVTEEAGPDAVAVPPPSIPSPTPDAFSQDTPLPAASGDAVPAADDAPIYKWVDENGITHYTNRSTRSGGKEWEPAWEEETPVHGD
jgi:hypothetical protein